MVCQIAGAKDPAPLKVVAVEVHHLRAGRDAGDAVIERGPLLLAERGQRRRLGRGERERAPGVRGRGPMRIARAPEERPARLAEAIERADEAAEASRDVSRARGSLLPVLSDGSAPLTAVSLGESPAPPRDTPRASSAPSAPAPSHSSTIAFAEDSFTSTGRIATPCLFASPAITAGR